MRKVKTKKNHNLKAREEESRQLRRLQRQKHLEERLLQLVNHQDQRKAKNQVQNLMMRVLRKRSRKNAVVQLVKLLQQVKVENVLESLRLPNKKRRKKNRSKSLKQSPLSLIKVKMRHQSMAKSEKIPGMMLLQKFQMRRSKTKFRIMLQKTKKSMALKRNKKLIRLKFKKRSRKLKPMMQKWMTLVKSKKSNTRSRQMENWKKKRKMRSSTLK